MQTNLERMYLAGRRELPKAAEELRGVVNHLSESLATIDTQSAKAGDPPVLRSMLLVNGDVHDVLRQAIGTLYDAATAIILTADDFVATDEDARQDLARLAQEVRDMPDPTAPTPPPAAGNPEAPGAPGTASTPDPVDPKEDRSSRDHRGEAPTDRWGR